MTAGSDPYRDLVVPGGSDEGSANGGSTGSGDDAPGPGAPDDRDLALHDVVDGELVTDEDVSSVERTILTDVAALRAERDEYLAALQRAQADFANYRKRVQRQQDEQSARAAGNLVAKLLPVLDALDLAEAHRKLDEDGPEPSMEAQALTQARALLVDALAREGLERVEDAGVPFDPVIHDAVAHAPAKVSPAPGGLDDDEGPGEAGAVVDEVLRSGYRWRGQVLRPAMVRVRG
jgi:molecular chaperone GrpE